MGFISDDSPQADGMSPVPRWAASSMPAETGMNADGTCNGIPSGRVRMLAKALDPGSAARQARTALEGMLRGAGLDETAVFDAKLAVAELAGNAERHGKPPYEMRVFIVGGVPVWCEVIDGDPDLRPVVAALRRPCVPDDGALVAGGRGLLLVRRLAEGHCWAYAATASCTRTPGKAVAFALPTPSGARHDGPPYFVPPPRLP